MKLTLIPPGQFEMGSPKELIEEELKTAWGSYRDFLASEGPRHPVRITKPFYLGKYVVTQEEYERVIGHNPSSFCRRRPQRASRPYGHETLPRGASVLGRGSGILPEIVGLA